MQITRKQEKTDDDTQANYEALDLHRQGRGQEASWSSSCRGPRYHADNQEAEEDR